MSPDAPSRDDLSTLTASAARHHAQGRLAEAVTAYTDALRLDRRNPALLYGFGLVLRDLGQIDGAATCFEAAFALDPRLVDAADSLGTLRAGQGRFAEAESCHHAALARRSDRATFWNNLANALSRQGRAAAALAAWRRAVLLDPALPEGLSNLGGGLRDAERLDEAERAHRRALRLTPDEPQANNNFGHALQARLHHAEAARWFRRALALDPGYAAALCNLGLAVQRLGDGAWAERLYGRALCVAPDLALAQFNRGLLRLERGELVEGWAGYGWRFASGQAGGARQPRLPAWRGEDLTGKRLLIWGEQGMGDAILFSSLCAEAIARARSVVIETDRRLVPLFARSFPAALVRAPRSDAEAVPDCDLHTPIGSLARVFRRDLSAFTSLTGGWLVPDPARVALWRDRVATLGPGLRVGIAWRSALMTESRRAAYSRLDQWGALFAVPGVVFVTLQYGACEAERCAAEARFGVAIHRWGDLDLTDDVEGTAALMANLDLVISPATAVGELAAALGVPVWRFGRRDWTQLGSAVRPWFPAQRLFQPHGGEDIPGVLKRMAGQLSRFPI
ncbi:tetratricopeptide repeat protein [Azospirillum formosense]|uniref:Tetratricopeptide repeat protein n=1 Tax=Azospirillum formosense TaxID=861533 RepID=A0ABX2KZB8_9PROT|nr:tetratricopeptide repeat protein [Azospirillum formosense]MBY3755130.1 tetratricopeptide repeat protein [Azospirillum formosense]NUB21027.1 tetratricopeptide repeat protein [Azospirillum formosense]